jgi:hypothetical protein
LGKTIVFHGNAPSLATTARATTLVAGTSHLVAGPSQIFLLSPANAAGIRAQRLLCSEAQSELAQRLHGGGVPLGELFTFMSSLYFRGKLTYAQMFARPPANLPGTLIITPSRGLVPPETIFTVADVRNMRSTPVDPADERYRGPLERDARQLRERLGPEDQIVLLGSIATPKYVEPLVAIFGDRLVFPSSFVGRGDMSRGGLLLQCSREGNPLSYVAVATTLRIETRAARVTVISSAPAAKRKRPAPRPK